MLDVAITGSGIVSALGCGGDRFHQAMMAGESAIREAPWHNGGQGRPNWWAIVRDFNPRDWMDERIESGTDLFSQFALAAARQAIDQAAIGQFDCERTGVVHGTSIGGARALMKAQFLLDTRGPHEIPRKTEIQIYPNMAASQIAMALWTARTQPDGDDGLRVISRCHRHRGSHDRRRSRRCHDRGRHGRRTCHGRRPGGA